MKKILFILLTMVCLCSCYNEGTTKVGNKSTGIYGRIVVKEINYKNHSYLEFKDEGLKGQGWVHNPDCKCLKNK